MTDLDAVKEAMRKCVGADSVLSDDRVLDVLARAALSSQSLSLSEAREENDRKDVEIERLKKLSDRYGVALMMIRAGCSDPARFAGNILDDRQPVNVELDEEDLDENHR